MCARARVCVCVPRNPFEFAQTARFYNPKVLKTVCVCAVCVCVPVGVCGACVRACAHVCVCVCVCVICTFRGGSFCSVGLDAPFGSGSAEASV